MATLAGSLYVRVCAQKNQVVTQHQLTSDGELSLFVTKKIYQTRLHHSYEKQQVFLRVFVSEQAALRWTSFSLPVSNKSFDQHFIPSSVHLLGWTMLLFFFDRETAGHTPNVHKQDALRWTTFCLSTTNRIIQSLVNPSS